MAQTKFQARTIAAIAATTAKAAAILAALLMTLFSTAALATPRDGQMIRVLNEQGQPIVGAEVLIGTDTGQPFTNNLLKTDVKGTITITSDWQGPQPVTISADGYLRTTFLAVQPEAHDFQLHTADAPAQIEIKGTTTDFPAFQHDGKVQFGLVYPAVHHRQLSEFDIDAVLSPQYDEIQVLTETIDIPSNLTLPEQQQNYILPITLNKPDYRVYVRDADTYRVTATHGQFPLKQLVAALRAGKQFYEVLDLFHFAEYGQRDIVVDGNLAGQDIPVSQVQVTGTVAVTGPTMPSDQVMISAAMVQQGDLYFMSDVKRVQTGETIQLGVPATQSTNDIVSLLMPGKEAQKLGHARTSSASSPDLNVVDAYKLAFAPFVNLLGTARFIGQQIRLNDGPGGLSVSLNPASQAQPLFLNLVGRPTISADNKTISFTPPPAAAGLTPVATYVVFSRIDHDTSGTYNLDHRFRLWELYQTGWTSQFQLPNLPLGTEPGKNYRWEIYFMATSQTHPQANTYFLDNVTHVTHNSFDL